MRIEPVAPGGRWHPLLWASIAALLLLPAAAMQFTNEVAWTRFDFAFAALLLGGGAALYELTAWQIANSMPRPLIVAAIIGTIALIWADGAVGIF